FPLLKQAVNLDKQNELEQEILATKKKPNFEMVAQGNLLSDVTSIPIQLPNIQIEKPNLFQYKAYANINQLIYDGGLLKATIDAKRNSSLSKKKKLEVAVYQNRLQINQLYFSVLLLQEKDSILNDKVSLLNTKLKEVKAGIKYGVLLPSQDAILEVEKLKVTQNIADNKSVIRQLKESLSTLIKHDVTKNTFSNEVISTLISDKMNRPEIQLFQLQKEEIIQNSKIFDHKNRPKLIGFIQGGIGNPALNMLDNSLQPYYIVGATLKWNPFDWNATKKEKEKLLINNKIIENQEEVFTLQTKIAIDKQIAEIERLKSALLSDKNIVELRKEVLKTVSSQLKNGVITASVYVTELSNLNEAKIQMKTHQIQLQLAKANYNTLIGNKN
ncbi:MAG TPA: TolC family protein, partial [Flavobacteriia bacterium]|nr:TolC family protein [Flavobacteriia bacterium]